MLQKGLCVDVQEKAAVEPTQLCSISRAIFSLSMRNSARLYVNTLAAAKRLP